MTRLITHRRTLTRAEALLLEQSLTDRPSLRKLISHRLTQSEDTITITVSTAENTAIDHLLHPHR